MEETASYNKGKIKWRYMNSVWLTEKETFDPSIPGGGVGVVGTPSYALRGPAAGQGMVFDKIYTSRS